jgi:hyperosmotically inducible protein
MKIPTHTLRSTCVAAALAVAAGSAFALDTGGFMRVAADTTARPWHAGPRRG